MPTYRVEFTKEYLFYCEETIEADNEDAARERIEMSPGYWADGVLGESSIEVTKLTPVVPSARHWVVTVRDGSLVAFPPEVYRDHEAARLAARRLAEGFSIHGGGREVDEPDFIVMRDWTITVIPVEVPLDAEEVWIGSHWADMGGTDPEAMLLTSRDQADAWVREEPSGASLRSVIDEGDRLIATFNEGDEEEWSTIWRAKVIANAPAT